MRLNIDDLANRKVILEYEGHEFPLELKFTLSVAVALEEKAGSLGEFKKLQTLSNAIFCLQKMVENAVRQYNADNAVKIPQINDYSALIDKCGIVNVLTIENAIWTVVMADSNTEDKSNVESKKKRESP
jgi:hypothetical protein